VVTCVATRVYGACINSIDGGVAGTLLLSIHVIKRTKKISRAVRRGHGAGVTQRPPAGYAIMTMMNTAFAKTQESVLRRLCEL